MMEIRELLNEEKIEGLNFAKKVYVECRDESYSDEGIETFYAFVDNKKITTTFKMYGLFENKVLKGMIATDKDRKHICLFFVDKSSQGKGFWKKLMNIVFKENMNSFITVNSSRIAIPIYQKLGFTQIEEEQIRDGLCFTPMKITF